MAANAEDVSGKSVVGGAGRLNIVDTTFTTSIDLSDVTTANLEFLGSTSRTLTLANGTTFTFRQAHLGSIGSIVDGIETADVVVTEVDGTVDLAEIDVAGTVTAQLVDASVNISGRGADFSDVTRFEVQDNTTFTLRGDQASGRTITAEAGVTGTTGGSISITELDPTDVGSDGFADAIYNFTNISAGAQGTGTAAGSFNVAIAASQRLNAATNLGTASLSLTSDAAVTLSLSQLKLPSSFIARTISGAGTVVVNGGLTGALNADLSAIDTNGLTLLLSGDVDFNGSFTTADPVTVNTDIDTVARTFNIEDATGLPTSFSLDNDVSMTLTTSQANGLAVSGAGQVVVTEVTGAISSDYSGLDVATRLVLAGNATFTGTFDAATAVTVDGAFTLDITTAGAANHPGSVVLANNAELKLTAAQAEALTVTGNGSVLITSLAATDTTNFANIEVPLTLQLTAASNVDFNGSFDAVQPLTITGAAELDILGATGLPTSIAVADAGSAVRLSSTQANGLGITGSGSAVVTDLEASTADLSRVFPSSVSLALDAADATVGSGFELASRSYTLTASGPRTFNIASATTALGAALDLVTPANVTVALTIVQAKALADVSGSGIAQLTDTSASAVDLNLVDANISVPVDATSVASITGSVADVLNATDNQGTLDTAANVVLVLSPGTASAADLNTLNSRTTGLVNGTALTAISGSPTDFDGLLAAITATQISVAANFDVTVSGEPSIAQLTAIDAANGSGVLTYTVVKDTTANLLNNAGGYITGSVDAVVTDTVTVAQMTTIDGYAASGGVSVANTGKISDTFTNLLNDRQLNDGLGQYVTDGPLVEVSVSASGVTAANADVLAGVQYIDMASGATLSISDTAANITSTQVQINGAFSSANVQFSVTGSVSSLELSDLSSGFGNASNVSLSLAALSENYSIADATWAAQHGYTSQMSVYTPLDTGLDSATLQSIDVNSLNTSLTPTVGTYTYEGLLKSLLAAGGAAAGWTNIQWLGSSANETLNLTGYANPSRSLKLDGGGGNDTLTGTTSADWILGGIGNDILAGGNGNDSIEGGAGDDRLTGGVGQDTMTGGFGADTFVFLAGDSGTISGSVFDTITGFAVGAGGDRLDLAGTAATQTNASGIDVATASGNTGFAINASIADGIISLSGSDIALVDSLDEWIGVARAVVTTNGAAGAFAFGSDTYMYQENTGGDLLIKLTGLSSITALSTAGSSTDTIWIS